jgi:hypothetical protein
MKTMADTVRSFWEMIRAKEWEKLHDLLHEGFRAEFPQSGEWFTRQQFVSMNRSYPGEWSIRLRDLYQCEQCVVTEVEVAIDGRTDRGISFFRVENGKVIHLREFWPEPFSIPEWRVALFAPGGPLHE